MDNIILPSIIAVVLSVLANLLTDRLKTWWGKQSLTTRAKNAKKLREEIELITRLNGSDRDMFVHTVVRMSWSFTLVSSGFLFGLLTLIVLVIGTPIPAIGIIGLSIAMLMVYLAGYSLANLCVQLSRVTKFESYLDTANKRLRELEK